MNELEIWRSNLVAAIGKSRLSRPERAIMDRMLAIKDTSKIPVDLQILPMDVARNLLSDHKLKGNERARLALKVYGMQGRHLEAEQAYETKASNPIEFGSILMVLSKQRPNAELHWNGRWYPVIITVEFLEDMDKVLRDAELKVVLGLGNRTHELNWRVDTSYFSDTEGQASELRVIEVLEKLGFRELTIKPKEFNLRLSRAEHTSANHGQQMWIRGSVLDLSRQLWFVKMADLPLGTEDMPRRAVIEPALEIGNDYDYYPRRTNVGESVSRMPLVRLFSFDMKRFVYADIDDIDAYVYDSNALERLYLPDEMKHVLRNVFETPTENLFGDLVRGKHGGIVILACGKPGVGKTLTAEVYAEIAERPLYVLEFGELGTTVEQIETRLQEVFARIVRWKAVLQFDECEIFLAQRGDSLERSAIVGIFLRMLDYYEGLLFLTTNRPEVMDEAIRSRVMLRLEYPDLDERGRLHVWQAMLEAASLQVTEGELEDIATTEVNGRQIRNFVRLARILHPDCRVTLEDLKKVMNYSG